MILSIDIILSLCDCFCSSEFIETLLVLGEGGKNENEIRAANIENCLNINQRHTYFFNFRLGCTLLGSDHALKGDSKLKGPMNKEFALWHVYHFYSYLFPTNIGGKAHLRKISTSFVLKPYSPYHFKGNDNFLQSQNHLLQLQIGL